MNPTHTRSIAHRVRNEPGLHLPGSGETGVYLSFRDRAQKCRIAYPVQHVESKSNGRRMTSLSARQSCSLEANPFARLPTRFAGFVREVVSLLQPISHQAR